MSNLVFTYADYSSMIIEEGAYTFIIVYDDGFERYFHINVDSTKPKFTTTGGKINTSDPKTNGYASGIKSITVDGKTVKNNSKLSKGTHKIVIIDKAGNKTSKEVKI